MLPIHPPCGSHSQWSSAAEEGPRAGPDAAGKPDLAARLYQICPSGGWAAPSRRRPGADEEEEGTTPQDLWLRKKRAAGEKDLDEGEEDDEAATVPLALETGSSSPSSSLPPKMRLKLQPELDGRVERLRPLLLARLAQQVGLSWPCAVAPQRTDRWATIRRSATAARAQCWPT